MENRINIAEILRNCPQGMELYSPLCGKCVFDRLNMGTIICKKQNTQEITFTSEGYYMLPVFNDCECMIFPSKDQRDWSKFQGPFKDGDIVVNQKGKPFILKSYDLLKNKVCSYCGIDCWGDFRLSSEDWTAARHVRYATEEEKAKLFDAIKANGYRWNTNTKTLEILVPDKFDINTLVPFESRVLVRDNKYQYWTPAFWGFREQNGYVTTYGYCTYCIPYEGNEHLLGTTDDCSDYYKNC